MNLLKILNTVEPNGELLDTETALRAMREAVRQALELAAERAEPIHIGGFKVKVSKQSILNVIEEIE